MEEYKWPKSMGINTIVLVLIMTIAAGCAQVEQIPEQVPKELPNPVSDFTQKDNFIIGLRWYSEGNFDIARKFWKPLAESGDCDAQYAMGLLYYSGAGVRKNRGEAVLLWTEASEQGQAQAQISLGAAYSKIDISYLYINCRKGCGVEKNLVTGYELFGLAAKMGTPRERGIAEKSIVRISKKMSPEEIEEARRGIEDWEPSPSRCDSREIFIVAPSTVRAFY